LEWLKLKIPIAEYEPIDAQPGHPDGHVLRSPCRSCTILHRPAGLQLRSQRRYSRRRLPRSRGLRHPHGWCSRRHDHVAGVFPHNPSGRFRHGGLRKLQRATGPDDHHELLPRCFGWSDGTADQPSVASQLPQSGVRQLRHHWPVPDGRRFSRGERAEYSGLSRSELDGCLRKWGQPHHR